LSLLKPRYAIEGKEGCGPWRKITLDDALTIANAEAETTDWPVYVWRREKRKAHLAYIAPPPPRRRDGRHTGSK
jgi:hypothetical protein